MTNQSIKLALVQPSSQPLAESKSMGTHYTIAEVAKAWRMSLSSVLRIFKAEPGVLRMGNLKTRRRTRISLRIPADVVDRVHARMTE